MVVWVSLLKKAKKGKYKWANNNMLLAKHMHKKINELKDLR